MPNVYAGASARWHDDYELGRPGWPAEVLEVARLPAKAAVAELGAGTGKLTRLLVKRFADVVAVEPDEGMRRRLGAICVGARVLPGSAEEIPLEDASVDAVFAAESFHWFDPVQAPAEIARVLRPLGALVLAWNLPAGPTQPSIEAAERVLRRRAPDETAFGADPLDLDPARYASGDWRRAFEHGPFEQFREVRIPHVQTVDREALVSFFASMGWIAALPDAERLPLLEEARARLGADEYDRPWESHVHWTRLRADPR